jgi:hypothetical protein
VIEKIKGEKKKLYSASNVASEGKWVILVKKGDLVTLVPLHRKLKFLQITNDKLKLDQEEKNNHTFSLMKNGKIKKNVELDNQPTNKKLKRGKMGADDSSDNGRIYFKIVVDVLDSYKSLNHKYDGEVDEEFEQEINDYREVMLKRKVFAEA